MTRNKIWWLHLQPRNFGRGDLSPIDIFQLFKRPFTKGLERPIGILKLVTIATQRTALVGPPSYNCKVD